MADPIYGTVAAYRAYHTARGRDVSAATDEEIETALLLASEWLDAEFISSFGGLKYGAAAQIREWPRIGVWDIYGYSVRADMVPMQVERATYEAAYRYTNDATVFFPDYKPNKYKSVSVSGAVSAEFVSGVAADFRTQFPQIAAILFPLLNNGDGPVSPLSGVSVRV